MQKFYFIYLQTTLRELMSFKEVRYCHRKDIEFLSHFPIYTLLKLQENVFSQGHFWLRLHQM